VANDITTNQPRPNTPTPSSPSVQVGKAPQPPEAAIEVEKPHQTVDNQDLLFATRQAVSVGRGRLNRGDLFDETIVAKPLSMGEGFFNLKPKSPEVLLRAINMKVITADGPSSLRYDQAHSQGYVNATPADIKGTVSEMFVKDGGTKIVNGDLILMKISRADYRAALKYKDQTAIQATQRAGTVDSGNQQIMRAAEERNIPSRLARKLQPFNPTSKELRDDFNDE